MPREDGPGLVIEASRTGPTVLALTVGLGLVFAVLDDLLGIAMRAGDPVRPTEVSNGLEALGVVDEIGEIDHGERLGKRETDSERERSQRHTDIEL